MQSKAKAGAGTQLQLGDGASPEIFTAVAEILTIKVGETTIKTADVTNMDSPTFNSVIYEEFIATVANAGEIDITYNWIPDSTGGQSGFRTAFDAQRHNFRLVFPISNPTTSPVRNWRFDFAAIVSAKDGMDLDMSKQIIGSGKLKISGAITLS